MFRDGQYLEVIKASDNCLATVVVTVQEKVINIKKRKVSTNKWLDLEDWAALYKILKKAILRNAEGSSKNLKKYKGKKCTRQLDVTYTIEPSESVKDVTLLPTIRVNVSPAKKKLEKTEVVTTDETTSKAHNHRNRNRTHEKDDRSTLGKKKLENNVRKISDNRKNSRLKRYLAVRSAKNDALEEYVPDAPTPTTTNKLCANLNYIPSKKSVLEGIQVSSNEYSPTTISLPSSTLSSSSSSHNKSIAEVVRYVPNSVDLSKISYETYEPSATNATYYSKEKYVPNSKGTKASVEEYHPDFTSRSKLMKFDDSYIPSSVRSINEH